MQEPVIKFFLILKVLVKACIILNFLGSFTQAYCFFTITMEKRKMKTTAAAAAAAAAQWMGNFFLETS